ncbi:hypothetical protein F5148DRAFT_853898 [Russula earlei]|uniref:Uncharacterized protein n=1 Tax=Russula earlei TaxID=71964 RepID=A0ACC0UMM1_9AGAM|nr:hypothetical protein F5148DRAFT_853898 [Russula earlei]
MYDDTLPENIPHKKHIFSRLSLAHKQRDIRRRLSEVYTKERLHIETPMPIIVQSPTPTDEGYGPMTPPRPVSRRKSHLELWIDDQHAHTDDQDQEDGIGHGSSPRSYPYLAYADMRHARSASCDDDSGSISDSFVLVDGGDGTGDSCREENNKVFDEAPPLFGFGTPQGTRSYTSLLRTPPSLRAFRFSLSSSRPDSPSPYDSSPSPYRHSPFKGRSFSMGRHGRAFSDGSHDTPELQSSPKNPPPTTSSPSPRGPWAFKRPSVLGTFTPPGSDVSIDEGSALHLSPPRPSFSSSLTFSSGTTGVSTDPCTPNIGSPTSAYSSRSKVPQHSLWSLPSGASHLHDLPNTETSVLVKPGSLRLPFSFKTSGKSFRPIPTVLPTSREKRKKKLVVSGIAKGDQARLEGVRKWCESFGEVSQITRMPNGDLHIDFRKAEVADTVCRVNARVHIAGVGSVSLSWYAGKRP